MSKMIISLLIDHSAIDEKKPKSSYSVSNLIHAHGICHACASKLHICHGNIAVMEVRLLG